MRTTLTAPCKVNLVLKLMGIRPDGYHELATLFHPLSEPADTLEFTPVPKAGGLVLTCSRKELETDDNLVAKAYHAYAGATGFTPGLALHLVKNIPSGAGLGGGSSDAAAVLNHLESISPSPMGAEALARLATGLGADVPFFLTARPAWARGVGELLEPAQVELSGMSLVLACPEASVSTPWAYKQWDRINPDAVVQVDDTDLLTAWFERVKCPFCPEAVRLDNDLEAAVFPAFPELRRLKEEFYRLGAAAAAMSGSGSSVFGLFRDTEEADRAGHHFQASRIRTYMSRL